MFQKNRESFYNIILDLCYKCVTYVDVQKLKPTYYNNFESITYVMIFVWVLLARHNKLEFRNIILYKMNE